VIRVIVVDDHELVRAGLVQLLDGSDDIEVAASAADGEEAIELARRERPEVVLMDLSMPGIDGLAATRRILAEAPDVRVVVLTSFSESPKVLAALDAGAVGYLLKDASPDELRAGIRAAARGESPLSPKAASAVVAARGTRGATHALSEREREVLILVAQGLPNKLIAARLQISEKTVKAHLTRVFQQIDVTDRTQAALWAQRNGIGDDAG
jgi:DNA-binding NarL/FixJ family response regulator